MTSDTDRRALLQLARDAITAHVLGQPLIQPPLDGAFARHGGAFVTLHSGGELRGCIGHIGDGEPLGHVIPRCAILACSDDPRFPPVGRAELGGLAIELSLLGPLERIARLDDIDIGRHGLIVELGWKRGLLLPQVATEWHWDREMFLAQTCQKAGLPSDAWRHGATVWRFEAEVFGESSSPRTLG
jgi:AmmeMemoRadiSam system protein A